VEGVVLGVLLACFGRGEDGGKGRGTFLPITPRQAMDGIAVVMVDVVLTMRGGSSLVWCSQPRISEEDEAEVLGCTEGEQNCSRYSHYSSLLN
jgi:hypothetical protein